MNLFEPAEIPFFPADVQLGWSPLHTGLPTDILSTEEQELVAGFTNQRRKDEFLTARHLFRFMVEKTGWDPNQIALKKEELGKPYIDLGTSRGFVSLSHSNNLVACAVSATRDVGLDVELSTRVVRPGIVKRILSLNEWDVLGNEHPIKLWTMKEAAVKRLGTGFRTNLNELEMEKGEKGSFSVQITSEERLSGVVFEAHGHTFAMVW